MRTDEIELKFIVQAEKWQAVLDSLSQLNYQGQHCLSNIYFDSGDNVLRRHDIGLRIRGVDQQYEMTLKGPAGSQSLAGIHQRAEYNIALSAPQLNLALLPQSALPSDWDIKQLQAELLPIFSTDFKRQVWLQNQADSQIEIVADQGLVIAGEQQEIIHEIELELKQGSVTDLLQCANQLAQLDGLRLGSESKAARGYRLAGLTAPQPIRPLQVLQVQPKLTLEQGLQSCLRYGLDHWQYHEELYLRQPENSAARQAIWQGLQVIRQTWALFSGLLPRKATRLLREQQSKVEALWLADDDKHHVIYHHDYLTLKLNLLQWLLEKQWLLFLKEADQQKLTHSYKRFCDIKLGRVVADLKRSFRSALTSAEFNAKQPALQAAILELYLLSSAYRQPAVAFIAGWQNLQQATSAEAIQSLRLQALQQPGYWLNGTNKDN